MSKKLNYQFIKFKEVYVSGRDLYNMLFEVMVNLEEVKDILDADNPPIISEKGIILGNLEDSMEDIENYMKQLKSALDFNSFSESVEVERVYHNEEL